MWGLFVFERAVFMGILWLLAGTAMSLMPGVSFVGLLVSMLGLMMMLGSVASYVGRQEFLALKEMWEMRIQRS